MTFESAPNFVPCRRAFCFGVAKPLSPCVRCGAITASHADYLWDQLGNAARMLFALPLFAAMCTAIALSMVGGVISIATKLPGWYTTVELYVSVGVGFVTVIWSVFTFTSEVMAYKRKMRGADVIQYVEAADRVRSGVSIGDDDVIYIPNNTIEFSVQNSSDFPVQQFELSFTVFGNGNKILNTDSHSADIFSGTIWSQPIPPHESRRIQWQFQESEAKRVQTADKFAVQLDDCGVTLYYFAYDGNRISTQFRKMN